ncbi:MAG: quinolinate synthase NadA [Acidobacteria bacterium]|nr:quinolinate synthase NadA [Acidobacteriota bacterium]
MCEEDVIAEILQLKQEHHAIILAHNYQIGEIQDLADCVGDSLELCHKAAKTEAEVVVFCGVYFMAEMAAILCPDKKVLIPDPEAGCSLASTVTAEPLRRWRAEHPGAIVVSYVNTPAEVKAESDYCCTSSNAEKVIRAIPEDKQILFLPDRFMGACLRKVTGRNLHLWGGDCHVHVRIGPDRIRALRRKHPQAEFLVHPECACVTSLDDEIPAERTHILSTGGMVKYAREAPGDEFVIATEVGILHRLRKESPQKKFIPANPDAVCEHMKLITLDKVLRSLRDLVYEVTVSEPIARRARQAIERMMELG